MSPDRNVPNSPPWSTRPRPLHRPGSPGVFRQAGFAQRVYVGSPTVWLCPPPAPGDPDDFAGDDDHDPRPSTGEAERVAATDVLVRQNDVYGRTAERIARLEAPGPVSVARDDPSIPERKNDSGWPAVSSSTLPIDSHTVLYQTASPPSTAPATDAQGRELAPPWPHYPPVVTVARGPPTAALSTDAQNVRSARELAPPWPHYTPVIRFAFSSPNPVSVFTSDKPRAGALSPAPKLVQQSRPRVFRPPPIGHKRTFTSSSMSSVPSATQPVPAASESDEEDPDEPFRFIPSLLERFPSLRYGDHRGNDELSDSEDDSDSDVESELGEDEERVNVLDWVRMHAPRSEVDSTCYDDETRKIALAEWPWATDAEMEWNDDSHKEKMRNQDLAFALAEAWGDVFEEDDDDLAYGADNECRAGAPQSDDDSDSETGEEL